MLKSKNRTSWVNERSAWLQKYSCKCRKFIFIASFYNLRRSTLTAHMLHKLYFLSLYHNCQSN